MSEIPASVDRILQEGHPIAFAAYDGYERIGRGMLGLSPSGEPKRLLQVDGGFFVEEGNTTVMKMMGADDPEWEFLAPFDSVTGNTPTIRLG